jgi:endonuclease G, mitochondrial
MFINTSSHSRYRSLPSQDRQVNGEKRNTNDVGKGYNEDFLDIHLDLPEVDAEYQDQIAPLKSDPTKSELEYTHFSVVMNKMRRTPMFTAVNIDGAQYNPKKRNGDWDLDPRIDSRHQLGGEAYSSNPYDRGHLIRRRDPMWGPDADRASKDTFAYTNAALQHSSLNQHDWLDLENHILSVARRNESKVTVFTGPVLKDTDPSFDNNGQMSKPTQIPTAFWKVMVWNDPQEGLKSESFLMSQEKQANGDGVPDRRKERLKEFSDFRIPLDKLEELTHLEFGDIIDSPTTQKVEIMPDLVPRW